MLACVRQTARRLPRPASFSTSAALAQRPPPSPPPVNQALDAMLKIQADNNPIQPPRLTSLGYPVYQKYDPGHIVYPNALAYKNSILKPRIHKKPAVAPGPEITRHKDTFHQFNLDPRHFTNNAAVLSHFVTEMGKIKSRDQTGLTLKSQRLMGRTIRRAKMMGIIPTHSKGYKRYF